MAEKDQEWIEITITRGVGVNGENMRPGDKLLVPMDREESGIPPLRWWQYTRKGELPEKAAALLAELEAEGVNKPTDEKPAEGGKGKAA